MTLPVPDSTPVCHNCGLTYGRPVRGEYPETCGTCAVCGAQGWTARAKEYGLLEDLPMQLRKEVFKKALHIESHLDDQHLVS